jgi:protein-tyrosine phosphatase
MFVPELHWVTELDPHRLALMAAPRGGERLAEEVAAWRTAGVSTVVSLLEPFEVRELELKLESSSCEALGLVFLSFPIPDHSIPASAPALSALVVRLVSQLRGGAAVAIHCRAGIGRTGLVAGCVLHQLGVSFENIFPALERARGVRVPDTPEQVEWVRRFAGESSANAL